MLKVLHLTHTNISVDGRILKEMQAIKTSLDVELSGIGIGDESKSYHEGNINYTLYQNRKHKHFGLFCHTLLYLKIGIDVLLTNVDIIHVHDWFMLPIAAIHKSFRRSRIIYDAHELESDTNTTSSLRKRAALITEIFLIRFSDSFITVSDSIKQWYERRFNLTCETNIVLNVPEPNASLQPPLRKEMTNRISMIYVGGIEIGRGIELAIDVVQEFKDKIDFKILGYGSKEKEYKSLVKKLEIINVHFLGRVRHDQVLSVVQKSDIGLCLIEPISKSDELCLPNKLFEYYNSGLRIISSDLPEISNFIKANGCGYVTALSRESLRNTLQKAYDERRKPYEHTILAEYSWEHQKKTLKSLYSKLIER